MSTAVDIETPAAPAAPPTPNGGVNRPLSNGNITAGEGGVTAAFEKWKRVGFYKKTAVALRVLTCLFTLVAAIVMATNKHGDWKEFSKYEEYRYVVAIGFLAFVYSMAQLVRFGGSRDFVVKRYSGITDFAGDQIMAYMLMSALSAAIPVTNRMREGADNMFTDAAVASISMMFFAFAASAITAIISGFKLFRQTNA